MSYYSNLRPEVMDFITMNPKKILDVGCGHGIFANKIKINFNCIAHGIEPNKEASDIAKENIDHVFNGRIEDYLSCSNEKFDIIFFNDILEHLVDPWSILEHTKILMHNNSYIIASIPNILHYQEFFDILIHKDFKYQKAGIMDKTHLRWFTPKSMVRLFSESGYDVDVCQGINPVKSKKLALIKLFSLGYLNEMGYPQYVIRAKK